MANRFGGEWTKEKLSVLENYLNFYMTALKNQKFKKIYIDCFAGSGKVLLKDEEEIKGSARIALDLTDKFDKYVFIEQKKSNVKSLYELKEEYPDLDITIIEGDCNTCLPIVINSINWIQNRGVLFIDPFATQLDFSILKKVAATKAIDVWYLFPFSAVNRLMKKDGNIDIKWENSLKRCFGSCNWKEELYFSNTQLNLFGTDEKIKVSKDKIKDYIYDDMKKVFPYVSDKYMELCNSTNSPMFLLFLLISNNNPKVIGLIKRVENYILKEK